MFSLLRPRWYIIPTFILVVSFLPLVQSQAATDSWTGPSGDWSTPANWSTGLVPNGSSGSTIYDVSNPTTATITHSASSGPSGIDTLNSFVSAGPFNMTGGILNGNLSGSASTFIVNNANTLMAGTLKNLTFNAGSGGQGLSFNTGETYLTSDILNVPSLTLSSAGQAVLTSTSINSSSYTVNLSDTSEIDFENTQSLNGASILFGSGGTVGIDGSGSTLTLGPTSTVSGGNSGGVFNLGNGGVGTILTNNGLVTASAVNGSYYLGALAVTNGGTINATNGSFVDFTYGNTTNSGTLNATGSNSEIYPGMAGTLTQVSSGKITVGTGAYLGLDSATINSGKITLTDTGSLATSGTSSFNAVLFSSSSLSLTSGALVLNGGLFNPGPLSLSTGFILDYKSTQSITSTPVTFGAGGASIDVDGTSTALTIASSSSISGGVNGTTNTIGGFLVSASNTSVINNGNITNSVNGCTYTISPTGFTNNGSLSTTNGATTRVTSSSFGSDGNVTIGTGSTGSTTSNVTISGGNLLSDGLFVVNGGSGSLNESAGYVSGTGTIQGNVTNTAGTFSPGDTTGTFHLTGTSGGTYTQNSGGTFLEQLAGLGPTQLGVLNAATSAALSGTLDIAAISGFQPAVGQSFVFISTGSLTGSFATISSVNYGYTYNVTYTPTGATLHVLTIPSVPELPSSIIEIAGIIMLAMQVLIRVLCNRHAR